MADKKLTLAEQIALAAEGKDASVPTNVTVANGGSLKTKSSSGN